MASEPKVRTELDGGVLTVTLADPDNRNALGRQMVAELMATMDRVDTDDDIRVVVLTNEGSTFCAGADLSERSDSAGSDSSDGPEGFDGSSRADATDPLGIFGRIRNSPKPWIGRIGGHAVAGGLGLAAATDISVAVEWAKMGFTEVRIGVAPAIISVICLPKMNRGEAAEAFLRGNRFSAVEGARLGLVNHAVAQADLDATVAAIVDDVILGGPNALALSKQLLARVPAMPFDQALAWAAPISAELFASAEGQEGLAAYLTKRKPSWVR